MPKGYKDRSMMAEADAAFAPETEETFFFPEAQPPVAVQAKSKEEAEQKLADNNNGNG